MEMTKNGIVYDVMPYGAVVVRVTWKTAPAQSVHIPSSVFGKNVFGIKAHAFENSDIVGVILPRCLDYIGASAFANCKKLTHVEFGKRGESPEELVVGEKAFYGCESLNFILGQSWLNLGDNAFEGCSKLQVYGIVKNAGHNAFKGCESLNDMHVLLGGKFEDDAFDENPLLSVQPCGGPMVEADMDNIFKSLQKAQATIRCFPSDSVSSLAYEGFKIQVV